MFIKRNCENCLFSVPVTDGSKSIVCKRYPPYVYPVIAPHPTIANQIQHSFVTVFPMPKKDDICGEFRVNNVKH